MLVELRVYNNHDRPPIIIDVNNIYRIKRFSDLDCTVVGNVFGCQILLMETRFNSF